MLIRNTYTLTDSSKMCSIKLQVDQSLNKDISNSEETHFYKDPLLTLAIVQLRLPISVLRVVLTGHQVDSVQPMIEQHLAN
ncbi:hypothetical protein EB796_005862 [Bugula neritina]|uniref:Uncharacterized protein n=1 Tax=Bugula neritina TaxID=10212 RepID=A0A7J7KB04_BUGNE|nr:hypothetical protein EB796_005862 [Bugula neritina]